MTRQLLPLTPVPSSYPNPRTAPQSVSDIWSQANATDGSMFPNVGREMLTAWNRDTAADEVQNVLMDAATPASGNFTLSLVLDGVTYTTGNIIYTATPSAVQIALLAAVDQYGTSVQTRYPNAGGTNTCIAGSGTALVGGTVVVTFRYALAGRLIPVMGIDNSGIGGGTFKVTEGTPGSGDHAVLVHSVPDSLNRTDDFTITVGAGMTQAFPYFQAPGWRQPDGNIYINADNNNIWFAVRQVPSV